MQRLRERESDQQPDIGHVVGRAQHDVSRGAAGEQQMATAGHAHEIAGVREEVAAAGRVTQAGRIRDFDEDGALDGRVDLQWTSQQQH